MQFEIFVFVSVKYFVICGNNGYFSILLFISKLEE